jgi:translation initiation factor IF-3
LEKWSTISSGTPATSAIPFSTAVQSTPRSRSAGGAGGSRRGNRQPWRARRSGAHPAHPSGRRRHGRGWRSGHGSGGGDRPPARCAAGRLPPRSRCCPSARCHRGRGGPSPPKPPGAPSPRGPPHRAPAPRPGRGSGPPPGSGRRRPRAG